MRRGASGIGYRVSGMRWAGGGAAEVFLVLVLDGLHREHPTSRHRPNEARPMSGRWMLDVRGEDDLRRGGRRPDRGQEQLTGGFGSTEVTGRQVFPDTRYLVSGTRYPVPYTECRVFSTSTLGWGWPPGRFQRSLFLFSPWKGRWNKAHSEAKRNCGKGGSLSGTNLASPRRGRRKSPGTFRLPDFRRPLRGLSCCYAWSPTVPLRSTVGFTPPPPTGATGLCVAPSRLAPPPLV